MTSREEEAELPLPTRRLGRLSARRPKWLVVQLCDGTDSAPTL